MKSRMKWILMGVTVALALLALWQVQHTAGQIRHTEEEKIRLWAGAISQRAQLIEAAQGFFAEATLDEHRKMEMYTNILQSFNDPDLNADLKFSLAYVNYIVDSARTPIIIASARDSIISVPQELRGQKLQGALLDEYTQTPPFEYDLWGMRMILFYKESDYHTRLREVIDGVAQSLMADITDNAVFVPVMVVDSTRRNILAYGNLDSADVATPLDRFLKLKEMASENDPIELSLADGARAYVYYEDTPLLRSLRWVPLFYIFIAAVLLLVAYMLARTARDMEQNRIWVGLAKETAHQLGTPLSSLMAWSEYLHGKVLTDDYAAEVGKDLHRLETITHRFSKIGSVPELKDEDVREVTEAAVAYIAGRSSKRVKFNVSFPEAEDFRAPLNRYLFEWVIENLCKNAIDAMEGEGTLTIVASQDARQIYVDVSDTGRGMTPAVQKRIFDSGFTTKSRGWGLGLPLARRIVNQYHRGRLFLKYSVPGHGTTFRIVLRKKT